MKLYGSINSPFVRMTMMTSIECGLGDDVELISTSVELTKVQPALEALSPVAKIPVLETDDGQAVYDSRVIMEYLCIRAGNTTMLPQTPAPRIRVLTLLAMAQGFGDTAVGLRYETFARPQPRQWPDLITRQELRIAAVMAELDAKWMADLANVTLGSIAVAAVLGYVDFRQLAPQWHIKLPRLADRYKQFSQRESMVRTAPKG